MAVIKSYGVNDTVALRKVCTKVLTELGVCGQSMIVHEPLSMKSLNGALRPLVEVYDTDPRRLATIKNALDAAGYPTMTMEVHDLPRP